MWGPKFSAVAYAALPSSLPPFLPPSLPGSPSNVLIFLHMYFSICCALAMAMSLYMKEDPLL